MSDRGSIHRALSASAVVALLSLLSACTITDSNGDAASAADARDAFGGTPSTGTITGAGNAGSSARPTASPNTKVSPAAGSAEVREATADALRVGVVPSYAELVTAAIRGRSRSVIFTVTAAEALPQTMPDANTTMSIGFRLKVGEVPYVLVANASSGGWKLSATKNGAATETPGTLTVEGTKAVIVVPWTFFSGPRTFTWTGYLGWNESGTVKSYAFDIAPNYGEHPFPTA